LLPESRATQILNEIPPDERADLFGTLQEDQSKHFLELMEADEAKDVEQLVGYSPDTAGGIMTTQFAWIPGDTSTGDAIEFLRQQENDFDFYQAYVLSNEKLLGIVTLRELLISPPSTKVKKIINKVPSIPVTTDQEEVARLIAKYDIPSIPVVDRGKKMQGVIQVDDVVDVIEDESTEDMHRFGGATPLQRRYFDVSIFGIVKSRLPWLVVLLFANFIAGFVIEQFSDTLRTMVSLAVFIPVLLACSGNAGMQVTSVVIRGLATEEIRFDQIWRVARRELSIGILMGVGLGVLVALRSLPIEGSLSFGLAVGLSMTAGIVIATTMGTLVPIVFDKLGFDPALVSAPLLTTIMDITSLLIYFSIAVRICHL
jgi:magnesium transporter